MTSRKFELFMTPLPLCYTPMYYEVCMPCVHHHFQTSKRQHAKFFLLSCRNAQNFEKSKKEDRPTGVLMSKNNTLLVSHNHKPPSPQLRDVIYECPLTSHNLDLTKIYKYRAYLWSPIFSSVSLDFTILYCFNLFQNKKNRGNGGNTQYGQMWRFVIILANFRMI